MKLALSLTRPYALLIILLVSICSLAESYDPLDPNGNIIVTWDINKWTLDGYVARVTIQNYYQYRHVDKPGWMLGWTWAKNEIIWSMTGAFATQQGNCSSFKDQIPHSCRRDPVIVDLMPEAAPENRSENCCRGGLLAAAAIDPLKSSSSFEITVGHSGNYPNWPLNLTLMTPGPGYTCGLFGEEKPTVFPVIGGRREVQVFRTWKSTCTYSSFVANKAPTCCVSLSSFYNPFITSCPLCSCGCRQAPSSETTCIGEGFQFPFTGIVRPESMLRCTDHMCPVQVHWHIKSNYREQWRVKLTVSNYNYGINYSDWNVVVQHPGFAQPAKIYSFNSTMLPTAEFRDDVALFWGIDYYNKELLQGGEKQLGSVTSEILFTKDSKTFSLANGWAFPRRIYFNGENCEMPLPDDFPKLPNGGSTQNPDYHHFFFVLLVLYLSHF